MTATGIHGETKRAARYCLALVLLIGRALAQANNATTTPQPTEPQPPRRQIVVSIPDRKLALLENGEIVRVYKVAVGARVSPTPTGTFEIVNRLDRPTYYHPHKVIPPGPDNPLGTRWIGLSKKGFGIHGTNEPHSIGRAASHGCIRMGRRDLEELFRLVRAGDEVQIRGERDEFTAQIFGGEPAAVATASTEPAEIAGQF
jgi:lipoprotein-anchoring transpeptidase ErfK/SrfK